MTSTPIKSISIQAGKHQLLAEIFDTPTGRAIFEALPLESSVNTWGDEIYFHIPVRSGIEPGAEAEVKVGDLAYWPTMPAFCIFFGPTPASLSAEPRPASAVNVFGRLKSQDLKTLRMIRDGEKISIQKVED